MHNLDFQPEMIGRDDELKELQQYLDKAEKGQGYAIFISGEAGIGKTKLVNELIQIADSKGFQILFGNSMYESLTPYMPFLDALKSGGLDYLFEEEVPRVEAVYLVTHSGILIKEVMRKETKLEPSIFASMLTAVGNFVKESLSSLSEGEKEGILNTLGYENHRIVIENGKNANLVVLIKGRENEFLIDDLSKTFQKVNKYYGDELRKWDGNVEKIQGIDKILELLIISGKYDGIYYGKKDPKARRDLLFENVSMGLSRYAQTTPILLCIEDLQWADSSSLALMNYIARNNKKTSLLILGTYRPEDIAGKENGDHPLIKTMQMMDQENLCEKIEVQRLLEDKMDEFIHAMFGETDFDDDFSIRIYRETEGNPLFFIQLLKFLVEEKLIVKDNVKWKLAKDLEDANIPSKIYNVILRRLNRVEKQERMILDYASVIGEIFSPNVLSDSMDIENVLLKSQLANVEQKHRLIHPLNGHYKFDHAKIKEVLYSEIPFELRREYHAIIAGSIENLNKDFIDDVIGDLAFHYYHCKYKDKALFYLLKATEKAKEEYSNEVAIKFYKQALEFEDDDKKRMKIFESMGDIYRIIGEYDKSTESFKSALELTEDKKRKAENIAKIGGVFERQGEINEAIRISHESLIFVDGEDCKEEALALRNIGVSHWHKGELSKAHEFLEKSIQIREKIDDREGLITCLVDKGRVHKAGGEYDEAMELFEKALGMSKKIDDQAGIAFSLRNIGTIHHMIGDRHKAVEYYQRSLELEEKIGNQSNIALCYYNIANALGGMVETEEYKAYQKKSMNICKKIGDKEGIARFVDGGREYSSQEGYDKAIEDMKEDLRFCERYGLAHQKTWKTLALAGMYYNNGDFEGGKKYLTQALELSKEYGFKDITAGALVRFGRYYKEKKRWNESIEYFNKALKIVNEIGMIGSVGGTHFELGLICKEKGEIERAKIHLNKALEIFEGFNIEIKVEEIREALKDL
ncbi:MAG: tetratricopeptide repeat protein [Thermoplasmata archaeon]|nr:MAG: tetratricopeptide repeat protein [Thermoplasmata archaeon]